MAPATRRRRQTRRRAVRDADEILSPNLWKTERFSPERRVARGAAAIAGLRWASRPTLPAGYFAANMADPRRGLTLCHRDFSSPLCRPSAGFRPCAGHPARRGGTPGMRNVATGADARKDAPPLWRRAPLVNVARGRHPLAVLSEGAERSFKTAGVRWRAPVARRG